MILDRRQLRSTVALILFPMASASCTGYATHLATWESAAPPAYLTAARRDTATPATNPAPMPTANQALLPAPPAEATTDLHDSLPLPDPTITAAMAPAADDPAFTAARLADGFTLPELEALVLLRNPEVRAATAEYRGVLERYTQTTALNDLLSRYSGFAGAIETGVGDMAPGTNQAGLYPFPGSVALRGEIIQQETAIAHEALEINRRTQLANVRRAYWDLLYARHAHATAIHEYDVVDSLKNTSAINYAAGSSPFAELVQVDIDHGAMKAAIPIRLEEVRVKEAVLRALLNLPATVVIGVPAKADPERQPPLLAETIATALRGRQELKSLRLQIIKTQLLIALAENDIHPGYSLNLSAFPAKDASRVLPGGARPESFATTPGESRAGSPPNAFYGLEEGYLRETRQTLAALQQRLSNEEAQTRSIIQEAWFQLDKARREEVIYREKIIPLSQVGIDTANSAFATGRASHAQLLDSYSKWFAATLAGQQRLANLGSAWATLAERVGVQLPEISNQTEPPLTVPPPEKSNKS